MKSLLKPRVCVSEGNAFSKLFLATEVARNCTFLPTEAARYLKSSANKSRKN
jgi:hypothetical protein